MEYSYCVCEHLFIAWQLLLIQEWHVGRCIKFVQPSTLTDITSKQFAEETVKERYIVSKMGSQVSSPVILQDVIFGSDLSHFSSSRDERVEVITNTLLPYNWTCQLLIETEKGKQYLANGFKINIQPAVSHQVIVTSAHSVFIRGKYAKKITVFFAGQKEIVATGKQLWAAPEFIEDGNPDYDYGLILLPGSSDDGFGWTTLLSDAELTGRPLSTCGYPADKPKGTLWISGGGVESVSDKNIYFMQDSLGTGSGSPVYTWHKGHWTVIGIQSFGGVFNTAVRFTSEVIHDILKEVSYSMSYIIQSQAFPNVYLRADTPSRDPDIEGVVNCYYGATTTFDIFPLQAQQSTETSESLPIKTIAPTSIKGARLHMHMEDKGRLSPSIQGYGVVSCRYGEGPSAGYYVHSNSDGSVSIESASKQGVYLCMDGTRIEQNNEGSGLVNCQIISEKSKPGTWEKFNLQLRK